MGQAKVLVTGATGLVAGQCIQELLEHEYDVRGTVRALATSDVSFLETAEYLLSAGIVGRRPGSLRRYPGSKR
jgi:uncharacterized protein YbjT (DUF2867 family)